jgi:hypothetical protein
MGLKIRAFVLCGQASGHAVENLAALSFIVDQKDQIRSNFRHGHP